MTMTYEEITPQRVTTHRLFSAALTALQVAVMSWDVIERIMLTMLIISSNIALLICILTTKCPLKAFIYKGLMLNDDVKKIDQNAVKCGYSCCCCTLVRLSEKLKAGIPNTMYHQRPTESGLPMYYVRQRRCRHLTNYKKSCLGWMVTFLYFHQNIIITELILVCVDGHFWFGLVSLCLFLLSKQISDAWLLESQLAIAALAELSGLRRLDDKL